MEVMVREEGGKRKRKGREKDEIKSRQQTVRKTGSGWDDYVGHYHYCYFLFYFIILFNYLLFYFISLSIYILLSVSLANILPSYSSLSGNRIIHSCTIATLFPHSAIESFSLRHAAHRPIAAEVNFTVALIGRGLSRQRSCPASRLIGM